MRVYVRACVFQFARFQVASSSEVLWVGKVGALQSCEKGKQAVAVTYVYATPADVSNGSVFTPPCTLDRSQYRAKTSAFAPPLEDPLALAGFHRTTADIPGASQEM